MREEGGSVSGPQVNRIFRDEKFVQRPITEQIAELERLKERAEDQSVKDLIYRRIASLQSI